MVDAADTQAARQTEARLALEGALKSEDLAGVPLLVYANKQDLSGAAGKTAVADFLGLGVLNGRDWFV